MRSHFLLLAPLLALVPFACTTTGDGTSASNSRGTGGETTGTASTSSSSLATGSGGASSGSDSSGTKSTGSNTTGSNTTGVGGASSGSNSTGSNSTGSNSTGSNSTGSNSTGSNSTGSNSTGSNSTGSNSTGSSSTGTNATGVGGASSGSNSTGSNSTGMGGASTGSNSTGSNSTGAGGSGGCAGYVDVKAPNGAQQHFTSACDGAWGLSETMTALGYQMTGGAPPGVNEIDLQGCTSLNPGSPGIHFTAQNASMPGTFAAGSITYIDNNGGTWVNTTDPYKVVITQLDLPGGVITGSFSATVIGPMDTKLPISGTFHVCRVSDLELP